MELKTKRVKKPRVYLRAFVNAKSENGSITLESAFVVPAVIFIVCVSIYIVLILFEQAQLQSSSDYAAQRAASVWRGGVIKNGGATIGVAANGGAVSGDGAPIPDNQTAGLYHRLFDPRRDQKVEEAANIANVRLDSVNLAGYTQADGTARYRNGVFGKTLSVGLRGFITMPNRKVTSTFGYGNIFGGSYAATSLMPDFAENIRCVDYVLDIEKKLEEASPEFAEAVSSFQDILGRIREYIGGIQ